MDLLYVSSSTRNRMDAICRKVKGTMPQSFKEKYPLTYAIIDASKIFIETPTDLHIQSSTWSNYKHHNTAKF